MDIGKKYLQEAKRLQLSGEFKQAVEVLDFCINQHIEEIEALHQLGILNWVQNKHSEAIELVRSAVSRQPDSARYRYNLATMLQMAKNVREAVQEYEQVLKLAPDHCGALSNLSVLYCKAGKSTDAELLCLRALKRKSDSVELWNNLGNALREQGRIVEALESYLKSINISLDSVAYSNYLLALCYQATYDPKEVFAAHCTWGDLQKKYFRKKNRIIQSGKKKLRIGYVSADFSDHAVSRFFLPIVSNHDLQNFEVVCYSNSGIQDSVTRTIQSLSSFKMIHGVNDDAVCKMIEDDTIDILVDLSGHTSGNRLSIFAQKAAPVQGTYLGYPNTTGLSCIDFRFTDEWADPEGQQVYHTEKLVNLPHGFLCYYPPENLPALNEPPCIKNGYITFGSFNNLVKITSDAIDLWCRLLMAFNRSRLYLKNRGFADPKVRERYLDLFIAQGIPRDRLLFTGPVASSFDHLSLYNRIDIALDTFPYNGTTTTCEALMMGVPVLSCIGTWHASRVSYSILKRIGLASLCAESREHFFAIAHHLVADHDALIKLRSALRQTMMDSSLCDGKTITADIERAYRILVENSL